MIPDNERDICPLDGKDVGQGGISQNMCTPMTTVTNAIGLQSDMTEPVMLAGAPVTSGSWARAFNHLVLLLTWEGPFSYARSRQCVF